MKPPFAHPGGKQRLAPRLLPLISAHTCYVEPFCGAAGLFFAKPPSQVEVLNDLSGDIGNTFRCLQLHADAVHQCLHLVINSREHFLGLREAVPATDIQRAARFLFLKALSFGADGETFGVQKTVGGGAARNLGSIRRRIDAWAERLQGVIIESKTAAQCIATYDSPKTFFYLDPPYLGGHTRPYAAWKGEDLAALAEQLRGVKGRWLLSFNDCPEVRSLFKGCRLSGFSRPRGISNNLGARTPYKEVLIRPRK